METVGYIVLALAAALLMLQYGIRWRMRRQEGKPLPPLGGDLDQVLQEHERVLLYLFSPTCRHCRAMTPVVDRLASRHRNVIKVDVSRSVDVARRFGVMATPTVVLAERGRIGRVLVGPQSEKQLESVLE